MITAVWQAGIMRGQIIHSRHPGESRGGIGAPSGTTRSPCQELAEGSADAEMRADRTKAGPVAEKNAVIGAPRGARVPIRHEP